MDIAYNLRGADGDLIRPWLITLLQREVSKVRTGTALSPLSGRLSGELH
jgi:hypothetical protein